MANKKFTSIVLVGSRLKVIYTDGSVEYIKEVLNADTKHIHWNNQEHERKLCQADAQSGPVDFIALADALAEASGGSGTIYGFLVSDLSMAAEQNSDFVAASGNAYPVNTLAEAVVVTSPAAPAPGDKFEVFDSRANASTNNITVRFLTDNVYGSNNAPTDDVLNIDTALLRYEYVDATVGWRREK